MATGTANSGSGSPPAGGSALRDAALEGDWFGRVRGPWLAVAQATA